MKQDWADETEDRMDPRSHGEDFDLMERTELVIHADKREVEHRAYYRLVEVTEREYCGIVSRRDTWVPFGRAKNPVQSHDPAEKVEFTLTNPDAVSGSSIPQVEKIIQKDLIELERAIKNELLRNSQRERAQAQQLLAETPDETSAGRSSGKASGIFRARTDATATRYGDSTSREYSLRIDNLSVQTTEEALRVLCKKVCNNVTKVYIPMIKENDERKCKGFAFLTFSRHSDAESAKEKLDRLPFLHSVLTVSWGSKSMSNERK